MNDIDGRREGHGDTRLIHPLRIKRGTHARLFSQLSQQFFPIGRQYPLPSFTHTLWRPKQRKEGGDLRDPSAHKTGWIEFR